MKKLLLYCILLASPCGLNAQSTTATNVQTLGRYLGFSNNYSLLFQTNALPRMKLNNSLSYTVNGYNTNRDGYLLIGFPGNSMQTGLPIYTSTGAYSMLHLNGRSVDVQEYGHKSWMQTGITFTDNKDLSYVGLRKLGAIEDFTEMVIAWSDNGPGIEGPDRMVFRFSGWGGSDGTVMSSNLLSNTDLDGLHIAEFMPSGLMGLGNSFGTNSSVGTNYVDPQSLFHQSYTHQAGKDEYGFMQMTYRPGLSGGGRGFGETEDDGLRLGIDNAFVSGGLNAYLRWQEGTPFIVQTDWDDVAGDVIKGERFRVSATGMPGTPNVFGSTPNVTRISVPWRGDLPVDSARALLHLGYNANSGYAAWMDYGTLVANAKSTFFTGITNNAHVDAFQAVIGYGQSNLLFIDKELGEVARFNDANGNFGIGNYGAAGLSVAPSEKLDVNGNARFRNVPVTTAQSIILGVQPGTDPNDVKLARLAFNGNPNVALAGDGTWQPISGGGTGTPGTGTVTSANNGLSMPINDSTTIQFGNTLGDAAAPAKLLSTREVPMNDYNIIFSDASSTYNGLANRIGIGTAIPLAKVDITMDPTNNGLPSPIGLRIANHQSSSALSGGVSIGETIGVYGNNYENRGLDVGVIAGTTSSHGASYLVYGASTANSTHFGSISASAVTGFPFRNSGVSARGTNGRTNIGGEFYAAGILGSSINRAVYGLAYGVGTSENVAMLAVVSGTGTTNYGVKSQILANTGQSIGVYSTLNNASAPGNRAGLFAGILESSVPGVVTSDSIFKTNVNSLTGSLQLLGDIRPVSYDMNTTAYPQFNFSDHQQFGFIAQQLEDVFPNLVHESIFPAQYDTMGVEIAPAIPYKSVNYTGLIPVNSAAIVELNEKVDKATLSDESIKTNVQDLNGSLDKVLAMRGVSYDWNQTVHPELNLDSSSHVGFIAQEIQQIDNRLTFTADDNLLHVEYDKVVPILAEAIEELNGEVESKDSIINVLVNENADQQETIDDLNDRLSQLENCLSGILPYLCQLSHSAIQANTPAAQEEVRKNVNITLSNHSTIILDQNVPNPFAEQTVINFSIPESVQKAQIHFYDGMGKLIQSVDVVERGLGSITVFGSDLSTGVYTYTLVADGQAVATKKMMKQ